MAIPQRKRPFNAALDNYNLREQSRGKMRKIVDGNALNMRPRTSVKWDDCHKKVVAKREQIGIAWRDVSPFIDSVHQCETGLADVVPVPEEIFGLENLMGVLTYEVWRTHLSESERSLLSQFLPRTDDVDELVRVLLMGGNFHFGNPFLSWGASLCSDELHPDVLLHRDRCFKARIRAYYSGLQKYHFDIIDILQRWKSRLAHCNDIEREIPKMWRKHRLGISTISSRGTKKITDSRKEKRDKSCICSCNTAKSINKAKTSKNQNQHVTSFKQCRNGIKSKSFNHLKGDVKSINLQPSKEFEEEERKKLHDHWSELVSRDLPVAFARRCERQLQRQLWMKWLEKDMEEKELLMDEDEENLAPAIQERGNDMATENLPIINVHNCRNDTIPTHCISDLQPMTLDSEVCKEDILIQEKASALLQLKDGILMDGIELNVPIAAAKDIWEEMNGPDSYCHPTTTNHGYLSTNDLTFRQPQFAKEQQAPLICLEGDAREPEVGEYFLHASSVEAERLLHFDHGVPSFSHANQDHCGSLPPFLKSHKMPQSFPEEHADGIKQPGLSFLAINNHPPQNGQLHQQYQWHLFEQRQIRERELYMDQIMQHDIYSNGRYRTKEHCSTATDSAHVAAPFQPLNNKLLNYDWLSHPRGQHLEYNTNTNKSIFNIHPDELLSDPTYGSMYSMKYTPARSFVSGGTGTLHQFPLNAYAAAPAAMEVNNTSMWMKLPNTEPGLHDMIGKPNLRPWHQ